MNIFQTRAASRGERSKKLEKNVSEERKKAGEIPHLIILCCCIVRTSPMHSLEEGHSCQHALAAYNPYPRIVIRGVKGARVGERKGSAFSITDDLSS